MCFDDGEVPLSITNLKGERKNEETDFQPVAGHCDAGNSPARECVRGRRLSYGQPYFKRKDES